MVQLVGVDVLAGKLSIGAADDDAIPMTTLSHLGGGRFLHSRWLLFASQWAELTALPMNVLRHTVVSSQRDGRLYIYLACAPLLGSICDRVTALRCSRTMPSHIGRL